MSVSRTDSQGLVLASDSLQNPVLPADVVRWSDVLSIAAAVLFVCLAFNGNSFWIDEGFSAYMGSQHRFIDLLDALRGSDSGDLQTAGYYVYLWAWVHCFGSSEFALRASNLPFLMVLCASFWFVSSRLFRSRFAWTICVLSPFLWFYVNEARVYLPLAACGSLAAAACLFSIRASSSRLRTLAAFVCVITVWLGAVADILAIFLIPGLLFLVFTSRPWRIRETWLVPVLVALPLFALDGLFILWTLRQPQTMHYAHFNPLYILLFGYELLGLQGIGPERNHLRLFSSGGVGGGNLAAAAAVGVLCLIACVALYLTQTRFRQKQSRWLASAGLVSLGSLCLVSLALQERFLPRHASAILPLFLMAPMPLLTLVGHSRRWQALAAATLCLIWVTSDLRLSFDKTYQKDDFRDAVQKAIELSKEPNARLLWVGDYFTAGYYGLRLDDPIQQLPAKIQPDRLSRDTGWKFKGRGIFCNFFSPQEVDRAIQAAPSSDHIYLVITKLDLYDLRHAWGPFVRTHAQALPINIPAFDFYKVRVP